MTQSRPTYSLIGKDFTPPDVVAKVTGEARYAEDFRAEGMLYCRLWTSPMPHGRVRSIDASEALALEGVVAILTADDVPAIDPPGTPILTNEPHYVGDPVLAVAAVDETTAQDALERIRVELEPLPFNLDPLEGLRPGSPNARTDGNVRGEGGIRELKWTEQDFAGVGEGQLPMGEAAAEWEYGDLEAGFRDAELVLDESFVIASHAHHSMEPRSAMAWWQNGKCYLYGSTQSQSFVIPGLARYLGIEPADLVYVAEFCGGGFGSKGTAYPIMAVPAYLAKKTNRPVLMRISRAEEYFLGQARSGFQGRIRMGFRPDGKITAVDLYLLQENGPYGGFSDWHSAGEAVSLVYTPAAMRFRAVAVETNTPPRGPQRGPGQNQMACAVEPLLDKAARALGVDRVEIRRINAPNNDTRFGDGLEETLTSVHLREALDKGAERFDWAGKLVESGRRNGPKVIGVGVGQAHHPAGSSGFDGLVRITPDGILHIHTGVGNLGTYSHSATARVAADVLGYPWEQCVIERGDTRKGLPWNLAQFGSNSSYTMSRTNYVAAVDAAEKLKEIAARTMGGSAADYAVGGGAVYARGAPGRRMTCGAAAARAIELGGKYSGQEVPEDLNAMTKASVAMLAGTGLIGVAKDTLAAVGTPPAMAVGYIKIELDLETGTFEILDYLGVADCGRVLHPQGLAAQVRGGAVMGFGMAALERHVYDPHWGIPAAVGFHQAKPPTYLDVPLHIEWDAVDIADPMNPVGARGIGEPVMGCAAAALLCAISDALGGHTFNRTPVVPDMIVNAAAGRPQSHRPLQTNTM